MIFLLMMEIFHIHLGELVGFALSVVEVFHQILMFVHIVIETAILYIAILLIH